ncbi:MAG: YabP/YqfC family sporulation protein [Lachnospiraceae bacterium]|nr:YabP/YqfC family sporulation protein [Lachnospiraceae bacterium]
MKMSKKPGFLTKEDVINKLNFPKDVCTGAINVSLTGNREAWIENYRGILEYSEDKILLQAKNCMLCVEGRKLSIAYYTDTDMKIIGLILSVKYI